MLEFISSLPDFSDDPTTQSLWNRVQEKFRNKDGVCYYKHPVLGTTTGVMADLTLFTTSNHPVAIRCLPYQIDEIEVVAKDSWTVNGKMIDSPFWELDDFIVALGNLIDLDRKLRRRLQPKAILALPLISQGAFESKFQLDELDVDIIWAGESVDKVDFPLSKTLSEEEWLSFRSVIQTASPLTHASPEAVQDKPTSLGTAIRVLDRQIKTLDFEQEKVAIQIAPGPQRVRGLAGTGKTVLLAMKTANIHRHFPDKKILFTFNTRSLYNQTRRLIEQFYGVHKANTEPDWTKIHVRHAWGSRNRPGVYSDICSKQGVEPLTLDDARRMNYDIPFQACCNHALSGRIDAEYDYIIVDEAQDFPKEFFPVLYGLSHKPHCIYWAYDELQSLASSSLEMSGPEELFGTNKEGEPLVVLDDQDYPGGIQKDFILNKSYRCPQDVLMLAHAIGLGLYNPKGCVQMLESKDSWTAIGYEVESNTEWKQGEKVTLYRPPQNSPNRIADVYQGNQKLVTVKDFEEREAEFDWLAKSIADDIKEQDVAPERIIVIILEAKRIKEYSPQIQMRLVEHNIASTIPGLIDDADSYAEEGRVTVSSVFRAKGNEAYIVYIVGFEELYNYVDAIENRNRAFTAISRSKAWVRITGTGPRMKQAKAEVEAILSDIPRFHFTFPDMNQIRNLDAITRKRRQQREQSNKIAQDILKNPELLKAMSPELLEQLRRALEGPEDEN